MNPMFDFAGALGASGETPQLLELFARMALAAVLGGLVAHRVWRRFMPHLQPPPVQGAQAQTLIAAAGALVIVVIGDSVARAFGLVGLGAFIRFRSGIKDPRDAAVMFVMIGIGMACGLGHPLMAVGAAAFVSLILVGFDLTAKNRTERTVISIHADNPEQIWAQLVSRFPGGRVMDLGKKDQKEGSKLVGQLDLPNGMDALKLTEVIRQSGAEGLYRVALEE